MIRAIETSVYWSHTRPNGQSCFTITLNGVGYSGKIVAENIAAGQTTPEKVMDNWMKSEGHRANILSTKFNQIGIGCYETGGVFYWVQLFGTGSDTSVLKSSLYPDEVPFARTVEGVHHVVSAYSDLIGFFMISEEIGQFPSYIVAGEETKIDLPYFYLRNSAANTLYAAIEPYVTSEDQDGKPFV